MLRMIRERAALNTCSSTRHSIADKLLLGIDLARIVSQRLLAVVHSPRSHHQTPAKETPCPPVSPPAKCQIRGLCVSPDLQCVLCVTDGLEGVYLLAVDNLADQDEAPPHPPSDVPNLEDAPTGNLPSSPSGDVVGGGGGGKRSATATSAVGAATTARHAPRRTVADTAFPSLPHLASRGEQRRRSTGAKAGQHPSAEPVFIASLARRSAGGDGKGQEQQSEDDDRGSRRHSTGSSGRGPRRRSGARSAAAPFECLWWVTRNGSHFAVIGGQGGEVRVARGMWEYFASCSRGLRNDDGG